MENQNTKNLTKNLRPSRRRLQSLDLPKNDIPAEEFLRQNSSRLKGKHFLKGDHLHRTIKKLEKFLRFDGVSFNPNSPDRYGLLKMSDFTVEDIEDYLDAVQENGMELYKNELKENIHKAPIGVSEQTQNRYIAAISVFFKLAQTMGLITSVPNLNWREVQADGKPRYFSDEEYEKILKNFDSTQWKWVGQLARVAYHTGMRRGEQRHINGAVRMTEDKKFLFLPKEITKTKKDRFVPLNSVAREAVENLPNMTKHFKVHVYNKCWNRARDEIAPNDRFFTGHTLRHTAATRLANSKFNIKHIATYLGHSSTRTTERYIKVDEDQLLRMSETLEGVVA